MTLSRCMYCIRRFWVTFFKKGFHKRWGEPALHWSFDILFNKEEMLLTFSVSTWLNPLEGTLKDEHHRKSIPFSHHWFYSSGEGAGRLLLMCWEKRILNGKLTNDVSRNVAYLSNDKDCHDCLVFKRKTMKYWNKIGEV